MAKCIMIQGTASDAGKSIMCAALCRILRQDGYRTAPFKSQNMALNSFITSDGLEIGRAQAMQAEAAGIAPDARMNPILLKPTSDVGSQVIINGKSAGNMAATEYFKYKKTLIPAVMEAYESLAREYDIIVIEGAGSPAEINLKSDDIVNMGLAKRTGASVLLVGDIDRGGVFASLYGTVKLLEPDEQALVRGLIINKFRGDAEILRPGLKMLEDLLKIPVAGVVPFARLDIDDEDSLATRITAGGVAAQIDIAVIRLPRISNFTDFNPLGRIPGVSLRYVGTVRELGVPDLIILPGSKSTIADLLWLRQSGLEASILRHAGAGGAVFGVCGGYQMLGRRISDPDGVETGGDTGGLGLLPIDTIFRGEKMTVQVSGAFRQLGGVFAPLSGARFEGYEIHMGQSANAPDGAPLADITRGGEALTDGMWTENVAGSYVHGIFDSEEVARGLVTCLMRKKGIGGEAQAVDTAAYKQSQYDLLADTVRAALDMALVHRIIEAGA